MPAENRAVGRAGAGAAARRGDGAKALPDLAGAPAAGARAAAGRAEKCAPGLASLASTRP